MKKKFLSIVMALMLVICIAGCGKGGLDSVPYAASLKTAEDMTTEYNKAKVGTYQLTANYETVIENNYPQLNTTETITIKTTVGNFQNNYYCQTETITSVGSQEISSETVILYNGWKYVSVYDVASGSTTKTKTLYTGIYPREETLNKLYANIDQEAIEEIGEKVYEKEYYYLLKQKLYNMNYSDTITRPDGTYYSSYAYEFGINKSGYIHLFNTYNELIIDDWTVYRTQTIKTKLVEYGANLFIEIPNDLNAYETI